MPSDSETRDILYLALLRLGIEAVDCAVDMNGNIKTRISPDDAVKLAGLLSYFAPTPEAA